MKKIALLLVLAVFLVSACSQQKAEDLVGQGTPVPQEKAQEQVQQPLKQVQQPPKIEEEQVQQPPKIEEIEEEQAVVKPAVKEFKMTAKQFSFEPGTIEVNKGDKVRLVVTSIDVPHGISIPEYGINERLDVGKPVTIEFTADKEGTFTAFCSVFCGSGHSNMKGKLIVK